MGGSTNTVLHFLLLRTRPALTSRWTISIRISRRVPCLAKVAPNSTKYHIEHVHRAGGIPALLGELNRAGLLQRDVHSVHAASLEEWLANGISVPVPRATRPRTVSCRTRWGAHDAGVLDREPTSP